MRLTVFLLLAATFQVSAAGYAQNITLNMKNAPLVKVLSEIKKQSGYHVVYEKGEMAKAGNVNINVVNATLDNVLSQVFRGQPLTYKINDKFIMVSSLPAAFQPAEKKEELPPPAIDVTVTVLTAEGQPLEGASIVVKGNNKGVAADANGRATLKGISADAVLIVSFTGYTTREVALSNNPGFKPGVSTNASIVVKLIASTNELTEVTVNKGYYTEKQRYSVGNVTTITAKDIEKQPVQNPLLALQGRVTGIEISQLTGLNGGGVSARIQGQNSINAGLDPLIVVDGVPFPSNLSNFYGIDNLLQGGSSLNYINPSDIESISILKDADATSIYGSRAANGAILITTKKGRAGKTKVSVDFQQGLGKVTRHIDMMNTRQYLDMRYEAYKNDGINLSTQSIGSSNYDLKLWDTTRYTDWQKVLIGGTAKYTNVNASISGGNNSVQYLIGAMYRRQTTVFPGNFDDKAGGLHFNISSNSPDKRLSVQFFGSYMYDNNHLPGVDLTQQAILLEPDAPALYNSNGSLNWALNASGRSTWTNPLSQIYGRDYNKTAKNLVSNLNLNYTILPGLSIGSSLGYTNLQGNNYSPIRLEAYAPQNRATSVRSATFGKQDLSNWIIEPQLKYGRKLGNGNIEGLIGTSFQKQNGDLLFIQASGFVNDQLMGSPNLAPTNSVTGATSFVYKYNAFFTRMNYNWKEKYIINLTGRRDGSSRFGDNNKFHNFGSAGAAWIFSEEKFLVRNLSLLSFGKIRGSYGSTGNDGIGDYLYLSTYQINNPDIPYQGGTGLSANQVPNPNLQWEETKKLQAGLDLGFVNDRILLGATYSRNQSSNQLITYSLPSITGFTFIQENFPATIRNTSWEFTLHTENFKSKNFSWSTDFNLTIPKNKLVSFPNIEKTSYADGTQGVIVGQPLGVLKMYNFGGVDPATGRYYPLDRDGKPVYYPNQIDFTLDQTALISPSTKYYGGLINAFSYKGVQLEFVVQFVNQKGIDGLDYWNGNLYPGAFRTGKSNQPAELVNKNHWQKQGDNAEISKYSTNSFANTMWPSFTEASYSYNASFIRLKNVSLSWQVPTRLVKKAKMQSATFYFRGENLATITKYKSLDPETKSNATLPPLQIWTIGTKLDF